MNSRFACIGSVLEPRLEVIALHFQGIAYHIHKLCAALRHRIGKDLRT
jgi:hypothetical protein